MNILLSKKGVIKISFLLSFSLFFSWLSAERFLGVDRDYLQYLSFFESLTPSYDGRFEIGFVGLSLFIKSLGLSFGVLLFISALISLSQKFYLIYQGPNKAFWVVVYLLMLFPLHEMTQIRASTAIGFGYLSLFFAIRENLSVRVVVLGVLSVLFHWTLLVFIPFIVFVKFFKMRKFSIVVSLIAFPTVVTYLSLSFLSYLNPQVENIINTASEMHANPFSSRMIIFIIIISIGMANINKIKSDFLPWFYLSVFGISFWYGMVELPVFAHRIFELTMFSCFLWVPSLPKYSRAIAMSLLAVLSIYLFINALYLDPLFRSDL
ncbi:MAG: EpsG family protein [Marinobacter sp.]|uniref:EpsG family protein n=1 Tax=Marinobacter sp. TaxID=50741 RepID=UPI0034A0754F